MKVGQESTCDTDINLNLEKLDCHNVYIDILNIQDTLISYLETIITHVYNSKKQETSIKSKNVRIVLTNENGVIEKTAELRNTDGLVNKEKEQITEEIHVNNDQDAGETTQDATCLVEKETTKNNEPKKLEEKEAQVLPKDLIECTAEEENANENKKKLQKHITLLQLMKHAIACGKKTKLCAEKNIENQAQKELNHFLHSWNTDTNFKNEACIQKKCFTAEKITPLFDVLTELKIPNDNLKYIYIINYYMNLLSPINKFVDDQQKCGTICANNKNCFFKSTCETATADSLDKNRDMLNVVGKKLDEIITNYDYIVEDILKKKDFIELTENCNDYFKNELMQGHFPFVEVDEKTENEGRETQNELHKERVLNNENILEKKKLDRVNEVYGHNNFYMDSLANTQNKGTIPDMCNSGMLCNNFQYLLSNVDNDLNNTNFMIQMANIGNLNPMLFDNSNILPMNQINLQQIEKAHNVNGVSGNFLLNDLLIGGENITNAFTSGENIGTFNNAGVQLFTKDPLLNMSEHMDKGNPAFHDVLSVHKLNGVSTAVGEKVYSDPQMLNCAVYQHDNCGGSDMKHMGVGSNFTVPCDKEKYKIETNSSLAKDSIVCLTNSPNKNLAGVEKKGKEETGDRLDRGGNGGSAGSTGDNGSGSADRGAGGAEGAEAGRNSRDGTAESGAGSGSGSKSGSGGGEGGGGGNDGKKNGNNENGDSDEEDEEKGIPEEEESNDCLSREEQEKKEKDIYAKKDEDEIAENEKNRNKHLIDFNDMSCRKKAKNASITVDENVSQHIGDNNKDSATVNNGCRDDATGDNASNSLNNPAALLTSAVKEKVDAPVEMDENSKEININGNDNIVSKGENTGTNINSMELFDHIKNEENNAHVSMLNKAITNFNNNESIMNLVHNPYFTNIYNINDHSNADNKLKNGHGNNSEVDILNNVNKNMLNFNCDKNNMGLDMLASENPELFNIRKILQDNEILKNGYLTPDDVFKQMSCDMMHPHNGGNNNGGLNTNAHNINDIQKQMAEANDAKYAMVAKHGNIPKNMGKQGNIIHNNGHNNNLNNGNVNSQMEHFNDDIFQLFDNCKNGMRHDGRKNMGQMNLQKHLQNELFNPYQNNFRNMMHNSEIVKNDIIYNDFNMEQIDRLIEFLNANCDPSGSLPLFPLNEGMLYNSNNNNNNMLMTNTATAPNNNGNNTTAHNNNINIGGRNDRGCSGNANVNNNKNHMNNVDSHMNLNINAGGNRTNINTRSSNCRNSNGRNANGPGPGPGHGTNNNTNKFENMPFLPFMNNQYNEVDTYGKRKLNMMNEPYIGDRRRDMRTNEQQSPQSTGNEGGTAAAGKRTYSESPQSRRGGRAGEDKRKKYQKIDIRNLNKNVQKNKEICTNCYIHYDSSKTSYVLTFINRKQKKQRKLFLVDPAEKDEKYIFEIMKYIQKLTEQNKIYGVTKEDDHRNAEEMRNLNNGNFNNTDKFANINSRHATHNSVHMNIKNKGNGTNNNNTHYSNNNAANNNRNNDAVNNNNNNDNNNNNVVTGANFVTNTAKNTSTANTSAATNNIQHNKNFNHNNNISNESGASNHRGDGLYQKYGHDMNKQFNEKMPVPDKFFFFNNNNNKNAAMNEQMDVDFLTKQKMGKNNFNQLSDHVNVILNGFSDINGNLYNLPNNNNDIIDNHNAIFVKEENLKNFNLLRQMGLTQEFEGNLAALNNLNPNCLKNMNMGKNMHMLDEMCISPNPNFPNFNIMGNVDKFDLMAAGVPEAAPGRICKVMSSGNNSSSGSNNDDTNNMNTSNSSSNANNNTNNSTGAAIPRSDTRASVSGPNNGNEKNNNNNFGYKNKNNNNNANNNVASSNENTGAVAEVFNPDDKKENIPLKLPYADFGDDIPIFDNLKKEHFNMLLSNPSLCENAILQNVKHVMFPNENVIIPNFTDLNDANVNELFQGYGAILNEYDPNFLANVNFNYINDHKKNTPNDNEKNQE